MIAVDAAFLVLIVLGFGATVSALYARHNNRVGADGLPALRGETSYAKAAIANHHDLQQAVHLLERVLREDAEMPRISGPLKQSIEQTVDRFYTH